MVDSNFIVQGGKFVRRSGKFVNRDTGCSGCLQYLRAFDACTYTLTDYWICINDLPILTDAYQLTGGSPGCLFFAMASGTPYQSASSVPSGGTLLTDADIESDDCACTPNVERIESCLISFQNGNGYMPYYSGGENPVTWELVDAFEIDQSYDYSTRYDYTLPIAGPNEAYVILGVSDTFDWVTPGGDHIWTNFIADDSSGSFSIGATVELPESGGWTASTAEAWFYGCPLYSWNESSQPTVSVAHFYPFPPTYYDAVTWSKSGKTRWLVFRGTWS